MDRGKKFITLIYRLTGSLLVLRAGEYLVDYFIGDKNGKMTSPIVSSGLSFLYSAIISAIIIIVILRILVALQSIRWMSSHYSLMVEKLSGASDTTMRISIFILALVVYGIQSYAFPLFPGRDYMSYLWYYFDYFSKEPVFHFIMLFRTPVTPFILGLSLQYGGPFFLELLLACCYSASIMAVYNIGLLWNRIFAVGAAIVVLLYPGYAILYHQASSDAFFSCVFFLWCVYIIKTYTSPSLKRFLFHGLWVFFLILIRPTSQLLLLFVLFAFLLSKVSLFKRLKFSFAFLAVCVSLMLAWSFHNYVRYEDFTISRGSGAVVPLYRLFIQDKIIKPENGKYSLELHETIQRELLPKEPYKSYGVTMEQFYSDRNGRMWSDLVSLSDRVWGWDSDYAKLSAVAVEAIKTHPYLFIKNIIRSYYIIFNKHAYTSASKKQNFVHLYKDPIPKVGENGLPIPTERQIIPRPYCDWGLSSPDNRMLPDPNSIELKFPPEQDSKYRAFVDLTRHTFQELPVREGNENWARSLNSLLSLFPKMLYWMLLSVIGFVFVADTRRRVFLFMFFLACVVIGVTYIGSGPIGYAYRVHFDPIFIIGGLVAFMKLVKYGMKFVR